MDSALLEAMSEEFAAYLSEVTDGDLTARTPCLAWSVDDLYRHMLELNLHIGLLLNPQSPPPTSRGESLPRETTYRDVARYAAGALANAANSASAADTFARHVTNTLIHTWDLARALDIDFDTPKPDVLDLAREYLHRLAPHSRGDAAAFAPIPDLPAADAMDEVLLLSGRWPSWRARPA